MGVPADESVGSDESVAGVHSVHPVSACGVVHHTARLHRGVRGWPRLGAYSAGGGTQAGGVKMARRWGVGPRE